MLLGFSSCKKQETYCGVEDPVNDIEWIGKVISSQATKLWIHKNTYNGVEGFYVYACINEDCTLYSIYYKNCGNILMYESGGAGGNNFPGDFDTRSTYRELIYSRE